MKAAAARPQVLIVDDDPAVLEALSAALTVRGAHVATAATTAQARRCLTGRRFAMVMTDLRLEAADDGLTVARLARRRAPQGRVVLFSGTDLAELSEKAAAAGVDEVLAKPILPAVLDRLLNDLLATRQTPIGSLDDATAAMLLARYVAGDDAAFTRLATAYRPMIYAVFLRWFRLTESDADDLHQEVLLQLVRKAAEVRDVRRWLLATAVNQAKKRIRTLIRQRRLGQRWGEGRELVTAPEARDIRELVERGLERLKTRDRQLLTLIYIEERSYQETAAILERPIGSIGPLRGRALQRLMAVITELETPPGSAYRTARRPPFKQAAAGRGHAVRAA